MLHVFIFYAQCTVVYMLYSGLPLYQAGIMRGHLAMQQIKLTQDHFPLTRGLLTTHGAMVLCRRGGAIIGGIFCVHVCVRVCVRVSVRACVRACINILITRSPATWGNGHPLFRGLDSPMNMYDSVE